MWHLSQLEILALATFQSGACFLELRHKMYHFSAFSKLRLLQSGILASDWADFWYSGVFGHGDHDSGVDIRK
jgi:hypothetical protein